MANTTVQWRGASGKTYQYWVYAIGTSFKEEPGNYIFAKMKYLGNWEAKYVGQTENLNARLENHEKEQCAQKHGADHIHVHTTAGGEAVRKAEEADLIAATRPPCNEQLK